MQQIELPESGCEEQRRVERVVETLTALGNHGESVAEVAHDVRNMVAALDLYCDLLQEPGVLAEPFAHYGGELRLVAAASRMLVERLTRSIQMDGSARPTPADIASIPPTRQELRSQRRSNIQPETISNLAEELFANRNLLAALAGPAIVLTVDVQGGTVPVRMTAEDLTRILVNLVKNAAEAMSAVGRIHISLWESWGETLDSSWITLNIEDNGPGLPVKVLEKIFEPRPASKSEDPIAPCDWPVSHRGLGLSITRSIVEAAGGKIHAAHRHPCRACFQAALQVAVG